MGTFTLSQYKSWVRSKLDDTGFDDTALTEYANEVNKEICNEPMAWPFMEGVYVGTVTAANGSTYNFPTGCQVPISIELTLPTGKVTYLDYMPYKEFDQRYPAPATLTATTPTVWAYFASSFIIGPSLPDQTYTLQMRYIKSPTVTTSDSSTLDIPDDFSELVVLGMYARALEHNDQPDYAAAQHEKFALLLSSMKQRLGLRQFGQIPVMQNRRTLLRGR